MTAAQIIRLEYGDSPNFMTPNRVAFGFISESNPTIAYELSNGRGFSGDTIWGVSVVELTGPRETRRLFAPASDYFHSRAMALRHIAKLQEDGIPSAEVA